MKANNKYSLTAYLIVKLSYDNGQEVLYEPLEYLNNQELDEKLTIQLAQGKSDG